MKAGKPIVFVLLAFVIGATISQGAFAFADDSSTNPFRAIWDAISELQVKTDSLQSQIDDLRTQQGVTTTTADQPITRTSDLSLEIEVAGGDAGQTLVILIARNAGPDNAVGVKLTAFYQTSLFKVNFMQGADCTDGSRGIIECYLGTITTGSETRVVIDATPMVLDQRAIITADLSSITNDPRPADNHAQAVFITSMTPTTEQPIPIPQQRPEVSGSSLTVQTDQVSYMLGETVTVFGNSSEPLEGLPVVIQIFNPNGEAYRFAQVDLTSTGTFSYTFDIGGELGPSGQYRIVASHGGASAETTLLFTNEQSQGSVANPPGAGQSSGEQVQEEQQPSVDQSDGEQTEEQDSPMQDSESTGQNQTSSSEQGDESNGTAAGSENESTGNTESGEGSGDNGSDSSADSGDSGTATDSQQGSADNGSAGSDDAGSDNTGSADSGSGDSGSDGGDSGSSSGDSGTAE